MAVVGKPLRLKDLLELDCDSCSAAGFRCYPRHLCVAVPLPLPARHETAEAAHGVLGRSRSLRHPVLSIRSLSRRLFSWNRRDEEEVQGAPVPASRSSDSEPSESGPSSSSSAERKSESDFSSASSAKSLLRAGVTTTAGVDKHEAMERESKEEEGTGSSSEADDKEQLSPVAVMDFPFHHDEDDDAGEDEGGSASSCSSPFRDSLAQLHQRRNIQLKHKLRRFRNVGEAVSAVDLGERFAASGEPDGLGNVSAQQRCPDTTDAAKPPSRLEGNGHRSVEALCHYPDEQDNHIALLTRSFSAADASEHLLLDFFAETGRLSTATESCEAAAKLAQEWILGTGARWGLKEVLCGREDLLAELDRGQRWSSRVAAEEEEREVGVVVTGLVIDELLRELLNDLLL